MLTIFALPTDFITNIGANTTDILSALSPIVELILGVLLVSVALSIIIKSFTKH